MACNAHLYLIHSSVPDWTIPMSQIHVLPSGRLRVCLQPSDPKPEAKRLSEPSHVSSTPAVFLTALEAAALLRVSAVSLARWRIEGHGPRFAKFGRRVVYDRFELLAWARSRIRQSTSEP